MSRFMKAMVVIVLTVTLGLGALSATGGVYDAYKRVFGDARWQTKLNASIDKVGSDISALTNLVSGWANGDDYLVFIPQTPTYVDGDTFTLPGGDYTAKLTLNKTILLDLGADGVKFNSVATLRLIAKG